jgi:hypothetical protein
VTIAIVRWWRVLPVKALRAGLVAAGITEGAVIRLSARAGKVCG